MKRTSTKNNFQDLYNSTIFTDIYKSNGWGGKKGEFYSGTGSHNQFVNAYSEVVADFILKNNIRDIVEIGCGDFNVTQQTLEILDGADYEYSYNGYDVVKHLIAANKIKFGSSKINFICKDSCTGNIKSGDLLIVRQVMQHLRNKAISQIVSKFKNYKYVLFTEHQPSERDGETIVPNVDQATGMSIRLRFKSGVYLDKEPFNCKIHSKLFEIPQRIYGQQASINTYLIVNVEG